MKKDSRAYKAAEVRTAAGVDEQAILARLKGGARSVEAVRKWFVQEQQLGKSGDFAAALGRLAASGQVEAGISGDGVFVRLSTPTVEAPPSEEEQARGDAWDFLKARIAKESEIAALGYQIKSERKRIKPEIERLEERLRELQDLKREKVAQLDTLEVQIHECAREFVLDQRKKAAEADPHGARAAARIAAAQPQALPLGSQAQASGASAGGRGGEGSAEEQAGGLEGLQEAQGGPKACGLCDGLGVAEHKGKIDTCRACHGLGYLPEKAEAGTPEPGSGQDGKN